MMSTSVTTIASNFLRCNNTSSILPKAISVRQFATKKKKGKKAEGTGGDEEGDPHTMRQIYDAWIKDLKRQKTTDVSRGFLLPPPEYKMDFGEYAENWIIGKEYNMRKLMMHNMIKKDQHQKTKLQYAALYALPDELLEEALEFDPTHTYGRPTGLNTPPLSGFYPLAEFMKPSDYVEPEEF